MAYSKIIFPNFEPQVKVRKASNEGYMQIFDPIRSLWTKLTPEEWVRQNVLQYFIAKLDYPISLIASEQSIEFNGLSKRCDAVVYNANAEPMLIMEFKAKNIKLTQQVFDQISVYNLSLKVPYLFVSNGVEHVFCKVDQENRRLLFAQTIPKYSQL